VIEPSLLMELNELEKGLHELQMEKWDCGIIDSHDFPRSITRKPEIIKRVTNRIRYVELFN